MCFDLLLWYRFWLGNGIDRRGSLQTPRDESSNPRGIDRLIPINCHQKTQKKCPYGACQRKTAPFYSQQASLPKVWISTTGHNLPPKFHPEEGIHWAKIGLKRLVRRPLTLQSKRPQRKEGQSGQKRTQFYPPIPFNTLFNSMLLTVWQAFRTNFFIFTNMISANLAIISELQNIYRQKNSWYFLSKILVMSTMCSKIQGPHHRLHPL